MFCFYEGRGWCVHDCIQHVSHSHRCFYAITSHRYYRKKPAVFKLLSNSSKLGCAELELVSSQYFQA